MIHQPMKGETETFEIKCPDEIRKNNREADFLFMEIGIRIHGHGHLRYQVPDRLGPQVGAEVLQPRVVEEHNNCFA